MELYSSCQVISNTKDERNITIVLHSVVQYKFLKSTIKS
jgi:hypothetical protein